jgi:hypothetical protein
MNMNHKFLIGSAAVAVLVVGALAIVHYRQGGYEAAAPDPNIVAPVGTVSAVSSDSISIRQQQDGAQKTFAISSTTLIISQVSAGETGKSLADIREGTLVILRPSPESPGTLASIQISAAGTGAPGAGAPAQGGTPVSLQGTVVTASPSMLVVKPQGAGAENVKVAVTGSTVIRSNVLAGQKGKTYDDIASGTLVFVAGVTTDAGVTASSVQVLVPIEELVR